MNQDQVLQLVKNKGPIIPSQISKEIGTNILLASAVLSELASRNLIKMSNIKIGGSPLYYVPGQEDKLMDFLGKLNEKDKRTCLVLQERKILRDQALDPLSRVSIRTLKDFAKPLEVSTGNTKEIFWKWYLLPNEELEPLIKKSLSEQKVEQKPGLKSEPITQRIEQKTETTLQQPKQAPIQQVQKPVEQPVELKPRQEVVAEQKPAAIVKPQAAEKVLEKPQLQAKLEPEKIKPLIGETKKTETEKPKERISRKKAGFVDNLKVFFEMKKITIIEENTIKKDSEVMFIVKVPSAVGEIVYCCYAKDKHKCSETDVSYAYVQGQIKKLPVMFITTGELTKKAKELLATNEFSNLTYVKV